jgi:hypothetical protein
MSEDSVAAAPPPPSTSNCPICNHPGAILSETDTFITCINPECATISSVDFVNGPAGISRYSSSSSSSSSSSFVTTDYSDKHIRDFIDSINTPVSISKTEKKQLLDNQIPKRLIRHIPYAYFISRGIEPYYIDINDRDLMIRMFKFFFSYAKLPQHQTLTSSRGVVSYVISRILIMLGLDDLIIFLKLPKSPTRLKELEDWFDQILLIHDIQWTTTNQL